MKAKKIIEVFYKTENQKYSIKIDAFLFPKNIKFPQGIKLRCVLIDLYKNKPVLLVDNHEPLGFHIHIDLPDNHDNRISLGTDDYREAIKIFMDESKRIINEE
jgi:hypothetical protein